MLFDANVIFFHFLSRVCFFLAISELQWRWRCWCSLLQCLVRRRQHTRYAFVLGVCEWDGAQMSYEWALSVRQLIRMLILHIQIKLIHIRFTNQVDPYVDIVHMDQVDLCKPYGSSWSVWDLRINLIRNAYMDQLDLYKPYGSSWFVRLMFILNL